MAIEDLNRNQHVEGSSDRAFGWVFAGFFLLIAGWTLFQGESVRWWAVGILLWFALIKPVLLARLNRLWMKLGNLLGKVVSPTVLGILFLCRHYADRTRDACHRKISLTLQVRFCSRIILDSA